jgi:molybdopterin converting factor small subunit
VKRSILFFGQLRDAAGASVLETVLPESVTDVPALIDWLGRENDPLRTALRRTGVRVALDKAFVSREATLGGAREVAFMSPLSGG